jgi:succinyl-diaminopimelate desuccinylase
MTLDCIALTQKLVQFASLNPPGLEAELVAFLGRYLEEGGLDVELYEFAPNRPSIVARTPSADGTHPLVFGGHIDVVPLGNAAWSVDPFSGEIRDGKLYGRGATDMKSGIAAAVCATLNQLGSGRGFRRGVTLVIAAGEETGCEGSLHVGRVAGLSGAELLIIPEPSSNMPVIAHKGSLRLHVTARGKTCHSSMPWVGDNAIDKVARWIVALDGHRFESEPHPLLGHTTASVTTISGGLNINSVPDEAHFTVDLRTIPGAVHSRIISGLQALWGEGAEIRIVTELGGFYTDPNDPAIDPVLAYLEARHGKRPVPTSQPYFTDASALTPALGNVPTVVIGPGEPEQCHQTDEYCVAEAISEATAMYESLIEKLCL